MQNDRRDFLKASVAAGLFPALVGAQAKDKKYRTALIGTGWWGMNILREAMAVDKLDSCGVYFGTTGGQVYCSPDGGNTWNAIVHDLPAVLSVEVQTLP